MLDTWALAIETLSWMEMQRLNEHSALAKTIKQLGIDDTNAVRLAHLLVYETTRRKNFIDKFINNTIKPSNLSEYNIGIQAFLRLYVYQTRIVRNWTKTDTKEAKSIARTVRAILGWKTLQKVETILGLLLTQTPKTMLENLSDEERTGLRTFHPTWFVKYCFKLFGRREAIAMFETDVQTPPTYIRLNTLCTDEETILSRLAEEDVTAEKINQLKYTYRVAASKKPLPATTSFQEGLFYIQDKASCFAAEIADPRQEMTVLDVCAAPGAKTTYLAQLMQNRGSIYSVDYSKRRMSMWKNEIAHMGVKIAEPVIADARYPLPFTIEADLVVLDPPCTGTGTFRKLPSAKWRLTPRSIERMAEIQWRMLDNCAESVKSGGTLVYSTCSITVEENEMLIERFLKRHLEFSLIEISPKMGLPGLRGLDKCQRLYPHVHQCNGFFVAKLQKE